MYIFRFVEFTWEVGSYQSFLEFCGRENQLFISILGLVCLLHTFSVRYILMLSSYLHVGLQNVCLVQVFKPIFCTVSYLSHGSHCWIILLLLNCLVQSNKECFISRPYPSLRLWSLIAYKTVRFSCNSEYFFTTSYRAGMCLWKLAVGDHILKGVHQFAPLTFHISSPIWVKFSVGDFM